MSPVRRYLSCLPKHHDFDSCGDCKKHVMKRQIFFFSIILTTMMSFAQANCFVALNNVTWNSLGTNEPGSMPLGNGDIALNVWTERSGDMVLLLTCCAGTSVNSEE